jgi:hypothetical protein
MTRSSSTSPTHLSREASRLVALSLALHRSGSRVEDAFWETELALLLNKLMRAGSDAVIDTALEHLSRHHMGGYEILMEQAETHSESCVLEKDHQAYDVLLVVAPVVAWTRYSIPTATIAASDLATLKAQLQTHILAKDTQVVMMPHLLSQDQMPQHLSETRDWMHKLGAHVLGMTSTMPIPNQQPEGANILIDTLYLVATVAVPAGKAIFRWQEEATDLGDGRMQALAKWTMQTKPIFAKLLTGCGFEIVMPDAYYASQRQADYQIRPLYIKSAVSWLSDVLNVNPAQLRAVIAGCGEDFIDEYRIGFTQKNQTEVIYGCIWPLYADDTDDEPLGHDTVPLRALEEIVALLKECGVTDIRRLPGTLPPDECEDCGAPYFPNHTGDMVHAELPEDVEIIPTHFH